MRRYLSQPGSRTRANIIHNSSLYFTSGIAGENLILGVGWLRTLGTVLANFVIPRITFNHGTKTITLHGEPNSDSVSTPQLNTLINKENILSLHVIYFHFDPSPAKTICPPITDPTLTHILQMYSSIFIASKSLPPSQSQDHQIPTIPTVAPVNAKPYRCPHYRNN